MIGHELAGPFSHVWKSLREGANPGPSPFSRAQVATIGIDGSPKLRNIIIRRTSEESNEVTFYTDIRSSKISEIKANPQIALVTCNFERNLQIRLEGTAIALSEGRIKETAWSSIHEHSRALFRNPLTPGIPISHPSKINPKSHYSDTSVDNKGYENFCVVVISVLRIDWLDLSEEDHKRIAFYRNSSDWYGGWIAP